MKLLIYIFIKIILFSNFAYSKIKIDGQNFRLVENSNFIQIIPVSFKNINTDLGIFQNAKIIISFKKNSNCDPFYLRSEYENNYSYKKNYSKIIEINQNTKSLELNVYQSIIKKPKFNHLNFGERIKSTGKNTNIFKGILIHKNDEECIESIKKTSNDIGYNFYKKNFFKKKIKSKNEINNFNKYKSLSKNSFKDQKININDNEIHFNSFVNLKGDNWRQNDSHKDYFKTKIKNQFNLNYITKDLFIKEFYKLFIPIRYMKF